MPRKLLLWCLPGHPYPPARPHYRRMLTLRAKDAMGGLALTFFRVVIHPAIWGMLLMAFRFVLRNIGGWDGWLCAHIHGLDRGRQTEAVVPGGHRCACTLLCMHPPTARSCMPTQPKIPPLLQASFLR